MCCSSCDMYLVGMRSEDIQGPNVPLERSHPPLRWAVECDYLQSTDPDANVLFFAVICIRSEDTGFQCSDVPFHTSSQNSQKLMLMIIELEESQRREEYQQAI